MKENSFLNGFVPKDQDSVEVITDLEFVVRRIASLLPPDILYQMFSSPPNETGGRSKFPYCRVDQELIVSRNWIDILEGFGAKDPEYFKRTYEATATAAFKAVVWVEIGFEGLDNLAESPASINWTSKIGHFVDDSQRAERIKTVGKEMYEQMLSKFVQFRDANKAEDDIFDRYKAENLLNKFRSG